MAKTKKQPDPWQEYLKAREQRALAEAAAVRPAVAALEKAHPRAFFNLSANGKHYIGGNRLLVCVNDGEDGAHAFADKFDMVPSNQKKSVSDLGYDADSKPITAVICPATPSLYEATSDIRSARFRRTGDHLSVG